MHGWVWFSLSCGQVRLKHTSTGSRRLRWRSITLRGVANSALHSFRTSKPCLDLIFLKAVRCPWLLRLQYPVVLIGLLPLQEQDPLHVAVDFWMQRSGEVFQPFALVEVQTRRPSFSTGISAPADFSESVFTSLHHCLLLRLYLFLASANLSIFSWVLFSFIVLNRWRFLAAAFLQRSSN